MLARLGAWRSFRSAAGLIAELFPLTSGGSTSTVRRMVPTHTSLKVDVAEQLTRLTVTATHRSTSTTTPIE